MAHLLKRTRSRARLGGSGSVGLDPTAAGPPTDTVLGGDSPLTEAPSPPTSVAGSIHPLDSPYTPTHLSGRGKRHDGRNSPIEEDVGLGPGEYRTPTIDTSALGSPVCLSTAESITPPIPSRHALYWFRLPR